METPIPFAMQLEAQYLPKNKFKQALLDLLAY
jgi:2-oxoisovalerate dehydrogenase E1 component